MHDLIQIRSLAKRNGLSIMLLAVFGLIISAVIISLLPAMFKLPGIFICSASLVTMLIGWYKLREPPYSIEMSKQSLCYKHRNGQWLLDWDNIQRFDVPKVRLGIESKALQMVGIKIKDYGPLLSSISPRLASNILMEQRSLLLHSDNESCNSGHCYASHILEDDSYQACDGQVYTGIKAMLANRMARLRSQLGYDLYIASAELDRCAEDFVLLLKQCQNQVVKIAPQAQRETY